MIIYAIGDSVVAGTELADEEFEGFPGYYSQVPEEAEVQKNFLWKNSFPMSDDLLKKEVALAFPAVISRITGVKSINAGAPGVSFDYITRNPLNDLLDLKKKDNNIIALVGTTETQRFEVAYPDLTPRNTEKWGNYFLTIPSKNRFVEQVKTFKNRFETEYHRQMRFYQNAILLKEFCKSNGINLLFVEATNYPMIDSPEEDLQKLKAYANIEFVASMWKLAEQVPKDRFCLQGHFSKHVHALAANEIIRKLKEKK